MEDLPLSSSKQRLDSDEPQLAPYLLFILVKALYTTVSMTRKP